MDFPFLLVCIFTYIEFMLGLHRPSQVYILKYENRSLVFTGVHISQ